MVRALSGMRDMSPAWSFVLGMSRPPPPARERGIPPSAMEQGRVYIYGRELRNIA